jgi:hypothetical protein
MLAFYLQQHLPVFGSIRRLPCPNIYDMAMDIARASPCGGRAGDVVHRQRDLAALTVNIAATRDMMTPPALRLSYEKEISGSGTSARGTSTRFKWLMPRSIGN